MAKPATDRRGSESSGLGENLLRSIRLGNRLEPRRWRKDDFKTDWEIHCCKKFGGLGGCQRERTPAVSKVGGPSKGAKAPATHPERNVVLHRTGINDEALEVVKFTVV